MFQKNSENTIYTTSYHVNTVLKYMFSPSYLPSIFPACNETNVFLWLVPLHKLKRKWLTATVIDDNDDCCWRDTKLTKISLFFTHSTPHNWCQLASGNAGELFIAARYKLFPLKGSRSSLKIPLYCVWFSFTSCKWLSKYSEIHT